jgi:peptidoglycan/xylan/chitin deacetylase (PgdA/CDA1 family)
LITKKFFDTILNAVCSALSNFVQNSQTVLSQCLWAGVKVKKAIALTFDDGPHPQYTPELLQVLDYYQIPASFFWLGICVNRAPELARSLFERGHWLGLHGYEHRSFPLLKPDQLKDSLAKTQLAISNACGVAPDTVRDVRPPMVCLHPRL